MKRCLIYGLASLILASIKAIIAITHFNSEAYLGKQYYEVFSSPYLSDEEREILSRKCRTITVLPTEFDKNPKRVKEQIKKSKRILKVWKNEAK